MYEFNSGDCRHYGRSSRAVGAGNGKGYRASSMYVVRSSNHCASPYGTYSINKASLPPLARPPIMSSRWHDCRQLERRKRIAKYKLYAVEGKVKRSLKKSFRWIKRTCRKIVHGF